MTNSTKPLFWPPRRIKKLLKGTIAESWEKCSLIWSDVSRVEDLPRGVLQSSYVPSDAKISAVEFAAKFHEEYTFVLERLKNPQDDKEELLAFDILDYMFRHYSAKELPDEILGCNRKLPKTIKLEIALLDEYSDFTGTSVGDFLRFQHERLSKLI